MFMKKILLVISTFIVLILLVLRGLMDFNGSSILYNEAVFVLYSDLEDQDVDPFFDLYPGTYNKDLHVVICKLPVEVEGFKDGYTYLNDNLGTIDCTAAYNEEKHVKYKSYELKPSAFKFLLIKKSNRSLMLFSESLHSNSILAEKTYWNIYKKGSINHLVVTRTGLNDYCELNKQKQS